LARARETLCDLQGLEHPDPTVELSTVLCGLDQAEEVERLLRRVGAEGLHAVALDRDETRELFESSRP
jgi:hypothetical protein